MSIKSDGKGVISLYDESFAIHWVRLTAEYLTNGKTHFICNDLNVRVSYEKQTFLMLKLISNEPRPFVEYIEGGRLRRAEIVGNGTKKSPYKAQWRNDFYID